MEEAVDGKRTLCSGEGGRTLCSGEGRRTLCSGGRRAKRTEAAEHEGAEEAEGASMTESEEIGKAGSRGGGEGEGDGEYIWMRSVRLSVIVEGSVGWVVVRTIGGRTVRRLRAEERSAIAASTRSWGLGSGMKTPCGNHCTVSVTRVVVVDVTYT